jgi:hypothetical protein
MNVKIVGDKLVIEVDANLANPPLSGSGKSRLVSSESSKTTVNVQGKQLVVSLNAYIKN